MASYPDQTTVIAPPADAARCLNAGGIVSQIRPLDATTRAKRENGVSKRVHGVFPSGKNGRSMRWSTPEQRDMMVLLEVDPGVIAYETAPEMVQFLLNDYTWEHVPAFRATMRHGPAVLDVFPGRGRISQRRQRLVEALTGIYADRGLPYRALQGGDVRLEPRFSNARWLRARSSHQPTQDEVLRVTGALSIHDHRTIAELQAGLPQVADVGAVVSTMAVDRMLTLDLSAATPTAMVVSLSPRAA